MSRSYKKTPIIGNTKSESEKSDKKAWHRKFRHKAKNIIQSLHNDDGIIGDVVMPIENEVGNTWAMSKDGKQYLGNWLKKNLDRIREVMGK